MFLLSKYTAKAFSQKVSEKETEILMTSALNHLKASNSLPVKVKIRPNIKTEQYNTLLI